MPLLMREFRKLGTPDAQKFQATLLLPLMQYRNTSRAYLESRSMIPVKHPTAPAALTSSLMSTVRQVIPSLS